MEDRFQFANPDYFYFLLLVPLLIVIYLIGRYANRKALKRFGDYAVYKDLIPELSKRRPGIKFFLIVLACISLVFCIARPQFGAKLKEVKRKGIEIIIALDVSNSMMANDIKPSRLQSAKRAISKLLERLNNDKIGLIVFAGDAYIQIPITTDYSATDLFLESVNTGIVPKQGTAIGAAIELGKNAFTPEQESNKALIIITDGENHEDDAIQAAKDAAEQGIHIYTIGMGLQKGAPIPIAGRNDFRKDRNGNVVISKLNAAMLQQIAAAGNGSFVQANNSSSALNSIYDEVNKLEKTEMETKVFAEYDEKFQYFAGLAFFFLFVEILILERKNRLLKNVKLFD